MRSTEDIEGRLRELLLAELTRRLAREKLPELCAHNHRQALDHRRTVYGETNESYNRISRGVEEVDGKRVALPVVQSIGLCMLGSQDIESWPGSICEEPIDAQRCPYFQYKLTRAEVYDEFAMQVTNPDWVETTLPAVHSLLWVLGAALRVESASWGARVLESILRWFRLRPKKSVSVLVYLPPLNAWTDEDRTGAPAPHRTPPPAGK